MTRAALAVLLIATSAPAQTPAPSPNSFPSPPTPFRTPAPVSVQDVYLDPEPVDLEQVSSGIHERRTVRTRGILEILEGEVYFQLRDGTTRVVVVPMYEVGPSLRALVGKRVEVVGLVRELVQNQGTCPFRGNPAAPSSLCHDPELPPKPDLDRPGRLNWPKMSITVWSGSDATPFADRRAGATDRLGDLLEGGGTGFVTAVGRFCGANLCGGLTSPPPSREAWVLQDGETAVWVIGRRPEGKGFRLDPGYKGDTARWLEVQGRLEACGATRCLRARSVALATRPVDAEPPD